MATTASRCCCWRKASTTSATMPATCSGAPRGVPPGSASAAHSGPDRCGAPGRAGTEPGCSAQEALTAAVPPGARRRLAGHLKLCSASLYFVPRSSEEPITRVPFRATTSMVRCRSVRLPPPSRAGAATASSSHSPASCFGPNNKSSAGPPWSSWHACCRCEPPRGSMAEARGVAGEELFSVQCTERVEMMAGDRCAPYVWLRVRGIAPHVWLRARGDAPSARRQAVQTGRPLGARHAGGRLRGGDSWASRTPAA